MKVIINDRGYALKKLTKEEAKEYIGKEVYVWDDNKDASEKRKLLEVFMPDCNFPFCVLRSDGKSVCNYMYCAPVPEEWYVYEKPNGKFFYHYKAFPHYKKVDHGPHEYCKQEAMELNEQKETEHCLTNYELAQLLKCFGVEWKSKDTAFTNNDWGYISGTENEVPKHDELKIRYKCGEWMPATRETVMKWWENEPFPNNNTDIARCILFMEWNK